MVYDTPILPTHIGPQYPYLGLNIQNYIGEYKTMVKIMKTSAFYN